MKNDPCPFPTPDKPRRLPFDLPTVVIDGDKLIATMKGVFVDSWERVK
jgi:hypothetical protein